MKTEQTDAVKNDIHEFRQMLIKAGVSPADRINLIYWFGRIYLERWQAGADAAHKIFNDTINK